MRLRRGNKQGDVLMCQMIRILLAIAALPFLGASLGAAEAQAQAPSRRAALSGFVTDASDGQPLAGATAVLRALDAADGDAPAYGVAANADGIYLMSGVEPGSYALTISFIGYESFRDTLSFAAGDALRRHAALAASQTELDEVLVRAGREHGMARITAGRQRILPEEIELVPSPDISADLANYLTVLPGVVTTGDRGGQYYVRGGEPSQNLAHLDGMLIYQPFHVLGFYSAFPADILNRVDFYSGGFPTMYSGRLASVIDVSSRYGNTRRFAGMASVSPFTSALRLEGPVVPGHASFLVAGRESFLERFAEPLLDKSLPFQFGDLFAKLYGPASRNSRLSISALRTHDRGTIAEEAGGEEPEEVRWSNEALGANWVIAPRILPVIMNVHLSHSRHRTEFGPPDAPIRTSRIHHTRFSLHALFAKDRVSWEGGWDGLLSGEAANRLDGVFHLPESSVKPFIEFGFHVQSTFDLGRGLHVIPGARLQWYQVRIDPWLEPRLRATWDRGRHHFSAAVGMYNQEVVGLTDRRDVANVFTIWTIVPRPEDDANERDPLVGRLGKAVHGLLGYRGTPNSWLEYSVEGFYRRMQNLFVAEWTAFPALTTRLHPARGRSIGMEVRAELRRAPFYGFVNYGLSSTRYHTKYEAIRYWFDTESLEFRPPHDRRHQVNALASVTWRKFSASARWSFGSGRPYTRPIAFDSFVLLDRAASIFDLMRSRRVIYDRPFNAVLPTYHRLDISVERTFRLDRASLTLQGSVINLYDRRNLFYLDLFTVRRVDQLPFVPSFGIRVDFE